MKSLIGVIFFHEKHSYDTNIEIVFRVFISFCLEVCAAKCCRKNLIIFPPFLIKGCGKGLQHVSAASYHLQSVQIRGWKSARFCFLYSLYSLVCYLLLAHRCWTWSKCCLCQSSCDLHWLQVILYQKQIGCTWHCDPTFRPLRPNQSS